LPIFSIILKAKLYIYIPQDAGLTLAKKFAHSNLGIFTLIHIQDSLNVKQNIANKPLALCLINKFASTEFNTYRFFKHPIGQPNYYLNSVVDLD